MLKNISLRHLIPLMFVSGALLLVVFFYTTGLPAARDRVYEISELQTHSLLLTHQSRITELLIENEPRKLAKEIYFTSTDASVKQLLIVDEQQRVRFASRSRLTGQTLLELGLATSGINVPISPQGLRDIQVVKLPGEHRLLLGAAALRFRRTGQDFNYTLLIVRDYTSLETAITQVAALPSELLATVLLVLSLLAVLILRRHLDSRLEPLLKASAKLANGDDSARTDVKGADEFAVIGRSFDMMANRLEKHHSELTEAKENAERANLAKNNFLTIMSQEIQIPLSGLMGFMDLLQDTQLDQEARLYVRSARSASKTLAGLINDLLETSRLDTGKIQVQNEAFCLNSLIQELVDTVLPRAMQKGISLKVVSTEGDPIWIESDTRIFRQILVNLLGNAVKYTDTGHITIAISSAPAPGNNLALSISVVDTGIGISDDEIGSIFERFYKGSNNREEHTGSGVGLAICKDLVALLGGTLVAESKLGEGSTLTFNTEVQRTTPPNDFNFSVLAQREQQAQQILLVESAEITRTLMRSILEKWGHTVTPCKDAKEAIEEMKSRLIYPDKPLITLIFMDLLLPGSDSFQTTEEIKGLDSAYERVPVIATTTRSDPDLRDKCLQHGIEGFVRKPIDRDKMADEVFRLTR